MAEAAGLDRAGAEAALADERVARTVREEEGRGRALGINSVPTFVINGEVAIPGAHEPEKLARALRQCAESVRA